MEVYASQGCLVLKSSFRGSAGYGEDFFRAGHNKFGGLTISDLIDATAASLVLASLPANSRR